MARDGPAEPGIATGRGVGYRRPNRAPVGLTEDAEEFTELRSQRGIGRSTADGRREEPMWNLQEVCVICIL